jgi:hypothetical protein
MKAFNILAFVLSFTLFSCDHTNEKQTTKDSNSTNESSSESGSIDTSNSTQVEFDHTLDNITSLIAGIKPESDKEVFYFDTTAAWNSFSQSFDSIWNKLDENRLNKMRDWKKNELTQAARIKSLFYPFSGPDFLNANMFFDQVDTIRMIGLEPVGGLPDISKMNKKDIKYYLNSVNKSLNDIFKRSYFITLNMINDLHKNNVNGTVPVICVFMKRTGHTIKNIEYVGIDSIGNLVPRTDSIPFSGSQGVKIEYLDKGSNKTKVLYYFKTDLSDSGLKRNKGFRTYLTKMDTVVTYLKAASHLLHYGTFSTIRNIILAKSYGVLQDDSGISYKFFDKKIWNVKLYGNYRKAVKDFTGVDQPELKKAYESDSTVAELPFQLGYHWGSDEINMQWATKKPGADLTSLDLKQKLKEDVSSTKSETTSNSKQKSKSTKVE